jgi:hypothetical protein
MECKCLFESRGESVCCESECKNNMDNQLQRWNLSQLKGKVQEYELIVNRSALPHDISSDQLEHIWICEKHKNDMGRNWRPLRTCQYPLHSGRKRVPHAESTSQHGSHLVKELGRRPTLPKLQQG